ncbi:type II secretion system protein D [Rheinheimera gaetbuli]
MFQPKLLTVAVVSLMLASCASTQSDRRHTVPVSKFAGAAQIATNEPDNIATAESPAKQPLYSNLEVYRPFSAQPVSRTDLAARFSDKEMVSFSAEQMPLKDLLHAVLNELLGVNYVLASDVNGLDQPVTLNIGNQVSKRRAFQLLYELLQQKGIIVNENEAVLYIHPLVEGGANTLVGFGREPVKVPQSVGNILQIVPLRFGNNSAVERTIREFTPVKVDADLSNNSLFISGNRQDILRALDLINLLDVPLNRGRNLAMFKLTFLTPEEFAKQVRDLLGAEGIRQVMVGEGNGTLQLMPIEHIGAVVAFSAEKSLLERVRFWAQQLDIPSEGPEKRYFIYNPRYARASDLGQSISSLIAPGSSRAGNQSRDTASAVSGNNSQSSNSASSSARGSNNTASKAPTSVQGENISLTIDERSNSLVFYTTGTEYQSLLPMIRRLDIMPKQVLLEATIAEVTLTDEFAMGVEFAIQNGSFGYGTTGAFGVAGITGLSLNYLKNGTQVQAKLRDSNSLVNVLSNPSIVVRDGVSASISVGNDIPTISSSTSDPLLGDRQTTTVTYRKTGLEFTVTPTINAQGLVVMEIQQRLSRTVDGSTIEGSPAIFERSIQTEVIAESGQTIMLGGLISEDSTKNNSKVPGFGDIPLIGNLFKSTTDKKEKTELILLITPRVIDSADQWHYINQQVRQGFDNLSLSF